MENLDGVLFLILGRSKISSWAESGRALEYECKNCVSGRGFDGFQLSSLYASAACDSDCNWFIDHRVPIKVS